MKLFKPKEIESREPRDLPKVNANGFYAVELPKTTYLFKELPLFSLEPFILIGVLMVSIGLYFAGALDIIHNGGFYALLVALLVPFALWFIKWLKYMPRGNKVIFLKGFASTGIYLSVGAMPIDRLIHFDKNDDIPPAAINNPKEHFELCSGRPLIIGFEGYSSNISLSHLLKGSISTQSAKELNNTMKALWGAAWQAALGNIAKFSSKFKDPTFWLAIISVGLLIVVAFLVYNQGQQITALAESTKQVATGIANLKIVNIGGA